MDQILLHKKSNLGISTKSYNEHLFRTKISDTDTYLNKLKTTIFGCRLEDTLPMPYCMHLTNHLENNSTYPIFLGPYDQHMSQLSLDSIDVIIKHNSDVMSNFGVFNKETIKNSHGKIIYLTQEHMDLNGTISKYVISNRIICSECNDELIDISLEDHIRSTECKEACAQDIMKAKGLVAVDQVDELEVLRAKSIVVEYQADHIRIYVEDWVSQAIKQYRTIRQRGGFEDLSLSEYLSQMSPSSE